MYAIDIHRPPEILSGGCTVHNTYMLISNSIILYYKVLLLFNVINI